MSVVQAANTNNMAGILAVCIAKGNAAHHSANESKDDRSAGFTILRHLTRGPK